MKSRTGRKATENQSIVTVKPGFQYMDFFWEVPHLNIAKIKCTTETVFNRISCNFVVELSILCTCHILTGYADFFSERTYDHFFSTCMTQM